MTPTGQVGELRVNTKFKVCILSAGKGIRLGSLTKTLNKSLLPIDEKAVISHIIEKFSSEVEIVVAVGHQGEKVREYLSHAHADRNITPVSVDNFDGEGSGPGYSLLCCREFLGCPFVIYAADTMVTEEIPPPTKNWLGVAEVSDTSPFCTVSLEEGFITALADKQDCDNRFAFVGVAGVHDHGEFWDALENDTSLINNEHQISNGLNVLTGHALHPELFTWFDTGTVENYNLTKGHFESTDDKFDFSKINEFTYFVNGRVIKYFDDADIVEKRFSRSKSLSGLCPPIDRKTNWFISYEKIKGTTLYECLTPRVAQSFFKWSQDYLWSTDKTPSNFNDSCRQFYKDKTEKRLQAFCVKYPDHHLSNVPVNGEELPAIDDLLKLVDWDMLSRGTPVNFHGDLQFDNVLKTGWLTSGRDDFKLLDWRQEFAGQVEVGDLYYDLGKLYGGMTLPYHFIKQNRFHYQEDTTGVSYDFHTTNMVNEAKEEFEEFIKSSGYEMWRIQLIRALIFLNMSPLHEYPFDKMLFHMSRFYLWRILKDEN